MRELPAWLTEALQDEGRGLTIEVIRLGAMGDILRTLPAVRLIRRALPRARLFWVLDGHWSVLLEGHPDLDGLLALPRSALRRLSSSPLRWPALLAAVAAFRRTLREPAADLGIDFHGTLRAGLVGRLTGARVRLGYEGHQQKEGNRLFSTHRVAVADRRAPRMERNLALVEALGLPTSPLPASELTLARAGREAAERIARNAATGGGPLAILAPGASVSQAYKKPPASLLAAAARRLVERGLIPLVVYGPGEEDDARRLTAEGPALLAPPTDLPTLAALLERATLFVGGDSGPLHLACSAGCPVLGLYGPTDPQVNRPWGVRHRVVAPPGRRYTGIKRIDRAAGGFAGIGPDHVVAALDALLEEGVDGRPSAAPAEPV